MKPYEATVANQRIAADPQRSAFVMANAGSGKTRVLIDRVARLLLAGADPAHILCITFTKAAAAEMAERLFDKLGAWSLASDEELNEDLTNLTGCAQQTALPDVRRLFARALETPGGLKIQTIHSFCEGVLRRFPLEAGVTPGFAVLDDKEASAMADAAINDIAASAIADDDLSRAFARLSVQKNEADLRALIRSAVCSRQKMQPALFSPGGLQNYLAEIAVAVGADVSRDEQSHKASFIDTLSKAQLARAFDALDVSGGNTQKLCATPIAAFLSAMSIDEKWAALEKLFLVSGGSLRKNFGNAATAKHDPWVDPYLQELQQKFSQAAEALAATAIYLDTAAFLTLSAAVLKRFDRNKAGRAGLDYDDLIIRTQQLFLGTPSEWIMFKLDQGLDHILLDEAQDTNPGQWDVIEGLLKEFLSGQGARDIHRTFFAVGDKKQSIYSFQGADVDLFAEKEANLGEDLAAAGAYANVPLTLSFRTTAPVLRFVDALFQDKAAAEGLGLDNTELVHDVYRSDDAGLIELWPLCPRGDHEKSTPWDAPVDSDPPDNPVRKLSRAIASTIGDWLASGENLQSKNRPIEPGDIMILVQSRGRLFDEVIRALAQNAVPVAGADKLKLLEDPAIEDLLSYARFALSPTDNLSLAEILKSPFFGLNDDELFDLAYNRNHQSLWSVLRGQIATSERVREIVATLRAARSIGLHEGPFTFLSHLLETGPRSGRRKLYNRLSLAVRDAIDEMLRQALEFERAHPRSLQQFVAWFEASAGEIKREMGRTHEAVRVMTVHGAKGLEANIVFLIDGHRGPNMKGLGPIFSIPANGSSSEIVAYSGSKDRDNSVTEAAREQSKLKQYEEYRRLLYVAATRACDRLYICGVESGNIRDPFAKSVGEQSWHTLATSAFDRLGDAVETVKSAFSDEPIRRISSPQRIAPEQVNPNAPPTPAATPDWLFKLAKPEVAPGRLAPSRLAGEDEQPEFASAGAAYSPNRLDRFARGRVLHRLLELLPEIEEKERRDAADRFLEKVASSANETERSKWRDEVLGVLAHPDFAPVFMTGSRAEVAVAGIPRGARDNMVISGQIDRLVICSNKILIVDYKTNRPPPNRVADAEPTYIAQMAAYRALLQEIYPDHQIDAALLWTFDARLMPIPDKMLDHAFERYLGPG